MCRIMSNKSLIACHLICKVIDFFGDIGVAWRIAKQLKVDFNIEVHLLVDDLMTSRRLIPSLDISLKKQTVDGITIHHCDFSEDSKSLPPPPAFVFNLFNIDLPNAYKLLMQSEKSKYIAIEYLSAEPWVENFHLKPSPNLRNSWRYVNAYILSYNPKWLPGVYVGLIRSLQKYGPGIAEGKGSFTNKYIPIVTKTFQKKNDWGDDTLSIDQVASFFVRIVFPKSKSELAYCIVKLWI